MKRDGSLLTGPCPFRSLPGSETPGALLKKLDLESGLFVSLPSLFFHSPQAGLRQTEEAISKEPSGVYLHGTCHPLLGEWPGNGWGRGGSRIKSVLLAPGFHHYSLRDPRVAAVVERASSLGLPVVLFRRLGDRRLAPDWLSTFEEELEAVRAFIEESPPCRLVLSQFFPYELASLFAHIAGRADLFMELGCFGGAEGSFADLLKRNDFDRWLYGSGAPLHYSLGLRSSLVMAAEEAGFPPSRFESNLRDCYGN